MDISKEMLHKVGAYLQSQCIDPAIDPELGTVDNDMIAENLYRVVEEMQGA